MEERLRVPKGWPGRGVIARVGNAAMADELRALRIPVVNVSGIQLPNADFPQVATDLTASGQMAARHFLDRGFRHFAYFSLMGLTYVAAHQRAFAEAATEGGGDFASFATRPVTGAEPDWNLDLAKLGDWLRSLPKPVAILTWNPSSAREIIYACQVAQILVPEEVAVLSGSDDDLICELMPVPVSGIQVAAQQAGYAAAELLDKLMRGKTAPKKPILLAPVGIKTRQSTDTQAIQDAPLTRALNFIRQNASEPVQVPEVCRHAGISRRLLERKFMQVLGRSPASEIRRVHVERAKQLLAETDMAIPEVAEAAGFGSPEYLATTFRKELNLTPFQYRKQVQK